MNVVFRADASITIGTGHVMRCLTLAAALREHGAEAMFICREHEGHLCSLIEERGFAVTRLPVSKTAISGERAPVDGSWLGASLQENANQTRAAIETAASRPDWLIVDHYALDQKWEGAMRASVEHIMAIDDLADRPHDCDLLLDQNFDNPLHHLYSRLLPGSARQLLGTSYAMVRPEFLEHREAALRRREGQARRLLVSMGGTDPENDTAKALAGLIMHPKDDLAIDVVIGKSNPHRQEIRRLCDRLPNVKLHIQTAQMAELMTQADLAINGGGSTTWERCVLGLPALVAIQSTDQVAIAEAISEIGGHQVLGWSRDLVAEDYSRAIDSVTAEGLLQMSRVSARLCDGFGANRVVAQLMT